MEITDHWLRSALWTCAKKKHELVKQVAEGNNRQPAEYEKLTESTDALNGLAQGNDSMRRGVGIATNSGVITVGQLEDFIRQKNRRMKDVLVHFGVNESVVKKLFKPVSKVYQAEKGWIKIDA